MQTRMMLFVISLAIFLVAATATAQQTFAPNEKGEVSAMTNEVRSLMEQADKVILETTKDREAANKKMAGAAEKLQDVISNPYSRTIDFLQAKLNLIDATTNVSVALRPAGRASHLAAMAYFDAVNAIAKAGFKIAPDGYGEWLVRNLAITHPIGDWDKCHKLMEAADKAQEAAKKREGEKFRREQEEFRERNKRLMEMKERTHKL